MIHRHRGIDIGPSHVMADGSNRPVVGADMGVTESRGGPQPPTGAWVPEEAADGAEPRVVPRSGTAATLPVARCVFYFGCVC